MHRQGCLNSYCHVKLTLNNWWGLSFTSHQRFSQGSEVSVSYLLCASPKKNPPKNLFCQRSISVAEFHIVLRGGWRWHHNRRRASLWFHCQRLSSVGGCLAFFGSETWVRRHVRQRGGRLIHLLHHGAIMTCRLSCVTHFQFQYECFMSPSGTLVGTVTLTIVLSDLVQWANNWPRLSCSHVDVIVENVPLIVGVSLKVEPKSISLSSLKTWICI